MSVKDDVLKDRIWAPDEDSSVPFYFRRANVDDVPFITSSWLRSYRNSDEVKGTPNGQYYHYQHKLIEALIPRSIVIVVANREDSTHILGWAVAELTDQALLLHYVYIKNDFREQGIASQLIQFMEGVEKPPAWITTHRTHGLRRLEKRAEDRCPMFHNRYLAFVKLEDGWTE